jgi:hypothetical protein
MERRGEQRREAGWKHPTVLMGERGGDIKTLVCSETHTLTRAVDAVDGALCGKTGLLVPIAISCAFHAIFLGAQTATTTV